MIFGFVRKKITSKKYSLPEIEKVLHT